MKTFRQFLDEQEKQFKVYGNGMKNASRLVRSVKPAKPFKPIYTGLNIAGPSMKIGRIA